MTDLQVLTEKDEAILRAWLMRDPLYNLFMIGNLELLGLGAEELSFWGQFSPEGEMIGTAMRYRSTGASLRVKKLTGRPLRISWMRTSKFKSRFNNTLTTSD